MRPPKFGICAYVALVVSQISIAPVAMSSPVTTPEEPDEWEGNVPPTVVTDPSVEPTAAIRTSLRLLVRGTPYVGAITAGLEFLNAILPALSDDHDDHPLYYSATASPSVAISATLTDLDMTVVQPLVIDEDVDDDPVTLEGTVQADLGVAWADVWRFSLTFTASIVDIDPWNDNTLQVTGLIQHLAGPHPDETRPGPGLTTTATIRAPFDSGTRLYVARGTLPKKDHTRDHGPPLHKDLLRTFAVKADSERPLFGDQRFTNWSFELHANHGDLCYPPTPTPPRDEVDRSIRRTMGDMDGVSLRPIQARGTRATVEYRLSSASVVDLAVFDLEGRCVAILEDSLKPSGRHEASWETGFLPSGLYFYRLRAGTISIAKPVAIFR